MRFKSSFINIFAGIDELAFYTRSLNSSCYDYFCIAHVAIYKKNELVTDYAEVPLAFYSGFQNRLLREICYAF